jgi:hypothetical protein
MITIGIRAEPTAVTFAIYDTVERAVRNVEELKIPLAFSWPDALKYVRHNILDVLREYNVEKAGIRTNEPVGKAKPSTERVQIEGVIQEAFASSEVIGFYSGPIATIASRAGIVRDDFKRMVANEIQPDIEGWGDLSTNAREALLCAMGAENA